MSAYIGTDFHSADLEQGLEIQTIEKCLREKGKQAQKQNANNRKSIPKRKQLPLMH
jgi:hypothetical protein